MNRTWLAYAQRKICHHREALENLHFISWSMDSAKFEVGDIVYLYMSNEKSIRFKTEVVSENVSRGDAAYWVAEVHPKPTYKLALRKEYFGDALTEEKLMQHGYKRGSLQRAICNNPRLFAYIEETFNDAKAVKICAEDNEALIRSGLSFGYGGEGDAHKELKEYIYNNPSIVGIDEFAERRMEHILLSADRLDVWFKLSDGSSIAVEVKSSKSSDADIMRGLYQCVKYKGVMDAEDKVHGENHTNRSILVLGGTLSEENRYVRDRLGITVVEGVELK